MKIKYLITLFCCVSLICSCRKQDIPMFGTEDAGVYFQWTSMSYSLSGATENYSDSIGISFATYDASRNSMDHFFVVKTMGKQKPYDRPVKIIIDTERTTAIAGHHYELNLDTVKIGAWKSSINVPIRFLRADDLKDEAVSIALKLEENEHFKCYFPEYKNTNSYTATGKMISGVKFIMTISETYSEPVMWKLAGGPRYYGPWSPRKHAAFNRACQPPTSNWNDIPLGRMEYYAIIFQKYLQDMADAGTPEKEADGSYMQLADNYQVDYSAYE